MENNIIQIKIWDQTVGLMYWEQARGYAVFEYDRSFIQKGLDIAPISMPIHAPRSQKGIPWTGDKDKLFQGLPPVFADSLPDKWGSLLFNRWIKSHRHRKNITPVDQLCYIGTRGMGALEYLPSLEIGSEEANKLDIQELYEFSQEILHEREKTVLSSKDILWQDLIKVGTSAGGNHPKAIIAYNEENREIRSGQTKIPEGFKHYILKFDEKDKFPFTRVEFIYYKMAQMAGIEISPSRLLETGRNFHFMTERFDRKDNEKIHIQTMAAMEPLATSYEELFKILRKLNLPAGTFSQLFRRMVFNVMGGNIDDHNKNFSFMMDKEGIWTLAPAYDLTFSIDLSGARYMNSHELTLNGKRNNITQNDLIRVAKENDISNYKEIIQQTGNSLQEFHKEAEKYDIPEPISRAIEKKLKELDISPKMNFSI